MRTLLSSILIFIIIVFCSFNSANAIDKLVEKADKNPVSSFSIVERLAYTTVKIQTKSVDGKKGFGTGFFFMLFGKPYPRQILVIVTNKHVIKNAAKGIFYFSKKDKNGGPLEKGHLKIEFDRFESRWYMHPQKNIDLCVMPIYSIIKKKENEGTKIFYMALSKRLIPTQNELKDIIAVDEILMVGYPIGLSDEVHNMPIIRKGIAATHPRLKYNGKDEFLIDAACYPGSSGSPVFLFEANPYLKAPHVDPNTPLSERFVPLLAEPSIKLLGILYGGPEYTKQGKIVVVNIPTRQEARSITTIPTNLGFVIRSEMLLDFENVFLADESIKKEMQVK